MGHVKRNEISYTTTTSTNRSEVASVMDIWSAQSLLQGTNNLAPNSLNNNNNNNHHTPNRNNQQLGPSSSFVGGQRTRSVGFNNSSVAAIQATWGSF